MSIAILISLTAGTLDGSTRFNPNTGTWTAEGNNRFRHDALASTDVGVIDPREVLQFLEELFGPFLGKRPPDVGTTQKLTDLLVERAVFFTGGATVQEFGVHSAIDSGGVSGRRLRQGPAVQATASAGVFQAGGAGQVSTALRANGQSGTMLVPTGQRIYCLSNAAAGSLQFMFWLVPIYAPRDIGKLVQAGQPPAVFI